MLKMLKIGALTTSINPWPKGMPKANKNPADYSLTVNGKELKGEQVMLTGGGSHPAYTYFNLDGNVQWFAGHVASGTAVEVIDPTPVAKPVEAKPAEQPAAEQPKPAEQPAPAKKQGKK